MQINQSTGVSIGLVAALVAALGSAWAWAESEHEKGEMERKELKDTIVRLETQNSLLRQIAEQQSELVKTAAEDAKENRRALIRIEATLEAQRRPE